jgi:phosphotriesterase-related protein
VSSIIRTVTGDISPQEAGITLTHEHIRYAYPGCDYDPKNVWNFSDVASEVTKTLAEGKEAYDYRTIVDLTPAEIGRHPELMAESSRRSGVYIVATAGFFPEVLGIPTHWRRQDIGYLKELLVSDLTVGMVYDYQLTPYKAGILKAATGGAGVNGDTTPVGVNGRRIGQFEDQAIRAIARVQAEIGCAINTHTQPIDYSVTNPGIELLDLLTEEGADPGKVIIGHALINPHSDQLREICERGANIQIDHIGIPWQHESAEELDELLANHIVELAEAGYLDQLVFAFDRFFHHSRGPVTPEEPDQLNELVKLDYLFEEFVPRLAKKGFGEEDLKKVLVDNPARIMAFDAP